MHYGHRTLIKFLLLELHTLDLLRNMALNAWHSRVCVFTTSPVVVNIVVVTGLWFLCFRCYCVELQTSWDIHMIFFFILP